MSDTFNWQLKPASGFPDYQPSPQQSASRAGMFRQIDPPPDYSKTTVDGRPLTPPGGPQSPDYSNEPYIPSRDRPHTDWGDDDWAMQGARGYPGVLPGPFMPQAREFASLLHGITMGMGRWGSHYSGMPAIAMGTYASAYWKAYQSGMKERAGEAWQQYRQAHQMFLDRQKEELQAARDGYALYGDNPDKLHQYMMGLVSKYHDNALENALAIDPAHVEKLWQFRDSKWQDAAKIKEQQDRRKLQDDILRQRLEDEQQRRRDREEKRKADEEKRRIIEKGRRQWDPNAPPSVAPPASAEPPPSSPPADDSIPSDDDDIPSEGRSDIPDDSGESAAAEEPPTAEEPATDRPIQVADASGQVPIGRGQTAPSPPPLREPEQETEPIENAARNWVLNHKLPTSLDKKTMPDIAARIETRGGQIESELNRLANDPKTTSDQMKSAVHRLMPNFANALDKYIAGDLPAPKNASASSPYWNMVYNLGAKIDNNFNADTFTERSKSRQFWANGAGGQTMRSVGLTIKHLETLLKDLPNKPYIGTAWIDRIIPVEGGVTNRLDAEITAVNDEFVRALQGKGGTIPELKAQSEQLSLGMTETNMRQNIDGKLKLLKSRIDQLSGEFSAATGWPPSELVRRYGDFTKTPYATDEDRVAADGINKLTQDREGDRKQFKQGWGVFRNGKWVPE